MRPFSAGRMCTWMPSRLSSSPLAEAEKPAAAGAGRAYDSDLTAHFIRYASKHRAASPHFHCPRSELQLC